MSFSFEHSCLERVPLTPTLNRSLRYLLFLFPAQCISAFTAKGCTQIPNNSSDLSATQRANKRWGQQLCHQHCKQKTAFITTTLAEFMHLVFSCMPSHSHCSRRLRSLVLCPLFYVWRLSSAITSLCLLTVHTEIKSLSLWQYTSVLGLCLRLLIHNRSTGGNRTFGSGSPRPTAHSSTPQSGISVPVGKSP